MFRDEIFMRRALTLARVRKGLTHPNPTVGCVIVRDGKIVGEGFHQKAGEPHAEVVALKKAGKRAEGSTVYVTLEPCSHYGRTPPCALALIKAKVKRVVVATTDPNPLVSGKGIEMLREAGIEVTLGVLKEEAEKLNEDFFHYITKGVPFVVLKVAQTLDGFIADSRGFSKWITSEESRRYVHLLRCQSDAVLVGVNTVLKDDPLLTVREVYCERQPLRVVLDTRLRIPPNARITDTSAAPTLVFTAADNAEKIKALEKKGVEVIRIPAEGGRIPLRKVLKVLAKREVVQLLVEGGASVFSSFVRENLASKLVVFTAPKVLGSGRKTFGDLSLSLKEPFGLNLKNLKTFGSDVVAEYYPNAC